MRPRNRFVVVLLLIALAASVLPAAFAASDKPPVTITYLTSQGSMYDGYRTMAQQLLEDENITVDFQVIPDDQYYRLVKTKIAAGEVPDIIEHNTPSNNIELNVQENCIPLMDQPWYSRLVNPGLLADPQDGLCYAMPLYSSGTYIAWYFNKTLLDSLGVSTEQPSSFEDFLDRCQQILDKSNGEVAPIHWADKDSWTTQIFPGLAYELSLYPHDIETWQKIGRNEAKWTDYPEFIQALEDFMSLETKGFVNADHLSATFDMTKEAIGSGKAAMVLQIEALPKEVVAKFEGVEMGGWAMNYAGQELLHTGAYVRGLFAMRDGEHVDEALRFLNLWSQPKYQNLFFETNPGFPAFVDCDGGEILPCVKALVDKYIANNQYVINLNDILNAPSPIYPDLWKMYVDMLSGGKTPQGVMDSWQVIYEDYMEQKGMPGF